MTIPDYRMISLNDIRIDGGTQQRPLCQEALQAYEERRRAHEDFPALQTVFDGKDHWLWDGFHRYHVARKVGDTVVMVEVTKGTQRDAVWLSFSANKDHGVQRPRDCAVAILKRIFLDPEWASVPQTEIARHVGVTATMVSRVRASFSRENDVQGTATPAVTKTVTRNGKTYSMKTSRIGRKPGGKTSRHAMKPVRTGRPMMKKTAFELPHDPASAANTLVSFFDRAFLEGLVAELSRHLKTQGE